MKKIGMLIAIILVSACAGTGNIRSEDEALALVRKSIVKNRLTALKEECYVFIVDDKPSSYEIDVREKHNRECGGDPNTAPRLFGYVVDKNTGKMKTDGSVPDEYTGEYKDID